MYVIIVNMAVIVTDPNRLRDIFQDFLNATIKLAAPSELRSLDRQKHYEEHLKNLAGEVPREKYFIFRLLRLLTQYFDLAIKSQNTKRLLWFMNHLLGNRNLTSQSFTIRGSSVHSKVFRLNQGKIGDLNKLANGSNPPLDLKLDEFKFNAWIDPKKAGSDIDQGDVMINNFSFSCDDDQEAACRVDAIHSFMQNNNGKERKNRGFLLEQIPSELPAQFINRLKSIAAEYFNKKL